MIDSRTLAEKMQKVFLMHDKESDIITLDVQARRFLEAKRNLISLLRNHPNWEEENLCIHQTYDTIRSINYDCLYRNIDLFCNVLSEFKTVKYNNKPMKFSKIFPEFRIVQMSEKTGHTRLYYFDDFSSKFDNFIKYAGDVDKYSSLITSICAIISGNYNDNICKFVTEGVFTQEPYNFIEGQKFSRAIRKYFVDNKLDVIYNIVAEHLNDLLDVYSGPNGDSAQFQEICVYKGKNL